MAGSSRDGLSSRGLFCVGVTSSLGLVMDGFCVGVTCDGSRVTECIVDTDFWLTTDSATDSAASLKTDSLSVVSATGTTTLIITCKWW